MLSLLVYVLEKNVFAVVALELTITFLNNHKLYNISSVCVWVGRAGGYKVDDRRETSLGLLDSLHFFVTI